MKNKNLHFSHLKQQASKILVVMLFTLFVAGYATNAQSSKEYMASEVVQMKTDMKNGVYDVYILAESGGNYEFSQVTPGGSFTIKAKEGLAEMPMISDTANSNKNRPIFAISKKDTIKVQGIHLDGSAGGSREFSMEAVSRIYADSARLEIEDCLITNFTRGWGIARIEKTATSISLNNTMFVGGERGVFVWKDAIEIGDITITNCTFTNLNQGAIHWLNPNSGKGNNILIENCTFAGGGSNILNIGDILGDLKIVNTIFTDITTGINFPTAADNDSIISSYTGGLGAALPSALIVKDEVTTTPTFVDAGNGDYTLTNQYDIIGNNGLPIGDPRWYALPEPPAVTAIAQSATNGASGSVNVQSSKATGTVYIILDGEAAGSVAQLDAAVTANKGAKAAVTAAGTDIAVSTTGLTSGTYYAYAVDANDLISEKGTNAITITDAPVPPVVTAKVQSATNGASESVDVQSSKATGTVYIILDGEVAGSVAELDAAVTVNKGAKAAVTAAGTDIAVSTTGLTSGTYYAYAVDANDLISGKGTNAITITDVPVPPVVTAAVQAVSNKAGNKVLAQSSVDNGSVYIILDGEAQSTVNEFDAAVSAGKGAKATVTAAATDTEIATLDLVPGTYYAYAVDTEGLISNKGMNPITIGDGSSIYNTAIEGLTIYGGIGSANIILDDIFVGNVSIYNMSGVQVIEQELKATHMNIALPNGMYLVHVKADNKVITKQVLVK